jgi:hypothetical protein
MPLAPHVGGSFAPPLPKAKLDEYAGLVNSAEDPQVKEILVRLHALAVEFQKTPPSKLAGTPHGSGVGTIVPLEQKEIDRIWEHVPWDYELAAMQAKLDELPADSPLRTPAFHLLWYAKELCLDREPITSDTL